MRQSWPSIINSTFGISTTCRGYTSTLLRFIVITLENPGPWAHWGWCIYIVWGLYFRTDVAVDSTIIRYKYEFEGWNWVMCIAINYIVFNRYNHYSSSESSCSPPLLSSSSPYSKQSLVTHEPWLPPLDLEEQRPPDYRLADAMGFTSPLVTTYDKTPWDKTS